MPWGAIIGAVGAIAGGAIQGNAAKDAANTEADSAKYAADLQAQQKQPWVDAGKIGLGKQEAALGPGGLATQRFTMADATNSAAEQAALTQGMQAINNSNAAKSGTLNSNALNQEVGFAETTAAGFEQQAFDQWNTQNVQQMQAIESLSGTGLQAAVSSGDSSANLAVGAGNAIAAGQIGAGNAMSGMVGNLSNIGMGVSNKWGQSNTGDTTAADTQTIYDGSDTYDYSGNISSGGSDYSYSDKRLKKDAKRIGKTKAGTPIYRYKMKATGETKVGVMAQDVEKKQPEAVKKHPRTGYKMVDYDKVK